MGKIYYIRIARPYILHANELICLSTFRILH